MLVRLTDDWWCDHSQISAVRKGLLSDTTISVCFFGDGSANIPALPGEVERIAKEVNAARCLAAAVEKGND